MKFLIKKIYITLFLLFILLATTKILARDNKTKYAEEDISNYFLGVISAKQSHNKKAFGYLKNEPMATIFLGDSDIPIMMIPKEALGIAFEQGWEE